MRAGRQRLDGRGGAASNSKGKSKGNSNSKGRNSQHA
jgi:hypothetical protein